MRRLIVVFALLGLSAVACGGSGGSNASGKNSNFCNLARNFGANFKPAAGADYKAQFKQLDSMIDQFQAAAPSEIKADVNTLIAAVHSFENAVKGNNYTVDASSVAAFSDPKVTQASTRLADYDSRVCGITTTSTT